MALTMEMLSIISVPKPPGPIPAGLKQTVFSGPDTFDRNAPCPALAIGGFTYFPFSYDDNRVSFGVVSYDPKGNVVGNVEVKGARYVYKITKDGSGTTGSVSFWGQANQHVTMDLNQLYELLVKK
ncbi:MAG TPA: hypothetical protein VG323_00030 [Thermoanaerobaculia bacterium]|nr:hypothetical protein [Thermoanaerobaculia bacterium]